MMFVRSGIGAVVLVMCLSVTSAFAQTEPPQTQPPQQVVPQAPKLVLPPPPPAAQVAATVNGQPVYEISVYRAIMREPQGKYESLRRDALNFLIDNTVVDQYVKRFNVVVTPKDIDDQVKELEKEAAAQKQDLGALLKMLLLTESELRTQLELALRWEKFVEKQATDEALKGFFDKNMSLFDGSQINARHILVSVENAKLEDAKAKAGALRQEIITLATQELAKIPPTADALAREKERTKVIDKAFADVAAKNSDCPSKLDGGNLGWFPRSGAMVEPFARAAFALKPYEVSDVVATNFGYHLILTVEQKAGKAVNFDEVKPIVAHFYGERLREAVLRQYKPQAQISLQQKTQ